MTFSRPVVPLLVPDLPDRHALMPYLERMDEARQYSNFGPLAVDLERQLARIFSDRAGAPVHVTTVSSATLGLELALCSMGLAPGSRVLVPAFTFVATATAVIRAGFLPVIADIDEESWMLTPAIADAAFEVEPFEAALPVAAFGQPHPAGAWEEFSRRRGIPVLIDAAGAYGSQWAGAGAGVSIVFSLHTTKSLPAGEGGLVVSADDEFIRQVRQRSNFGINLDKTRPVAVGLTDMLGTNAKLSEYHAAVGLASLARWAERAAVRRSLMERIVVALDAASHPAGSQASSIVWQGPAAIAAPTLLCVRWPGAGLADELEQECARQGVMTRRWYQPLLHLHPLAEGCARHLPTPTADRLASELIGLPFFPDMTEAQIALLADCVTRVARGAQVATAAQSKIRRGRKSPDHRTPAEATTDSTIEPFSHGHS